MEPETDKVETETHNHRADIYINRPDKRNALDQETIAGLHHAITTLEHQDDIRAATLLGRGKVFCAGMDLQMMLELATTQDESTINELHQMFNAMEETPIPIVAGIKQAGIAGGFELTLPTDLRVLGENAKYGPIEVKLGLFPSGGTTQRLPRLVGLTRAKEITMLGDYINPQDALDMGLVNEVCPDNEVDEKAKELADELAKRAPLGVQKAKQALNHAGDVPLDDGLKIERYLSRELFDSRDAQEGFEARIEDREPEFRGE